MKNLGKNVSIYDGTTSKIDRIKTIVKDFVDFCKIWNNILDFIEDLNQVLDMLDIILNLLLVFFEDPGKIFEITSLAV